MVVSPGLRSVSVSGPACRLQTRIGSRKACVRFLVLDHRVEAGSILSWLVKVDGNAEIIHGDFEPGGPSKHRLNLEDPTEDDVLLMMEKKRRQLRLAQPTAQPGGHHLRWRVRIERRAGVSWSGKPERAQVCSSTAWSLHVLMNTPMAVVHVPNCRCMR